MKMFEVGGCVRDEILGIPSKDIDFTVVMNANDVLGHRDPFVAMLGELRTQGFTIFLETPEFLTARAKFPAGHKHAGTTADFVLARKEAEYTDGRRPDVVVPGTLMDDLSRRDFTMNAIAKGEDGRLIDPFHGLDDIYANLIRTVGDPEDRFTEDALRILRAIRFAVTKKMKIHPDTQMAIFTLGHTIKNVSVERVRDELAKMFAADAVKSMDLLYRFELINLLFDEIGINLQPTLKEKVR